MPPTFLSITGKDGKFVAAEAEIKGNIVVMKSAEVPRSEEAKFAWTEAATPNLFNAAGLPAVPFRTNAVQWKYKSANK